MDLMTTVIAGLGVAAALGAGKGEDVSSTVPMFGQLTDARRALFENAMHARRPPAWFRQVAQGFEDFGLPVQAKLLRARAAAREAGPEVRKAREDAIRTLMKKRDPALLEKGADAAEQIGYTASAGQMRMFAKALRDAATVTGTK